LGEYGEYKDEDEGEGEGDIVEGGKVDVVDDVEEDEEEAEEEVEEVVMFDDGRRPSATASST